MHAFGLSDKAHSGAHMEILHGDCFYGMKITITCLIYYVRPILSIETGIE